MHICHSNVHYEYLQTIYLNFELKWTSLDTNSMRDVSKIVQELTFNKDIYIHSCNLQK